MERCRKLQAENEELGRDKAEGRTHALQQQLQLARDVADELRRSYAELYNHCVVLNEENEELQMAAHLGRLAAKAGMGGGRGGGGGGGGGGGVGVANGRWHRGTGARASSCSSNSSNMANGGDWGCSACCLLCKLCNGHEL